MEGMTDGLAQLIAESVSKRLRKEQPQADGPKLSSVGIMGRMSGGGMATYPKDLVVWPLQLFYTPDKNPDAPELWESCRRELEQALRTAQKRAHEVREQKFIEMLQIAEQRREEAQRQLEEENTELINTLASEGDGEYFLTEYHKLTSQARELGFDQVGVAARRDAIENRIDELRAMGSASTADDPIIAELQKALDARQRVLESRKTLEQAGSPGGEPRAVSEAEAALADANVLLLRAKRDAVERASGGAILELNNELSTLVIKSAELAEKQKAVKTEISKISHHIDPKIPVRIEMLKTRIALAKEQLADAERRLSELRQDTPPGLEQITLRPLEEALLGDDAEAAPADTPKP
jgi:hypothetical protein